MSNPSDAPAERPPFRAIIAIQELQNGVPGAFTFGLALSSQDPEQIKFMAGGEDETTLVSIPSVDVIALALADIIKTSPKSLTDRLEAVGAAMARTSAAIAEGVDPTEAARANLGQPTLGVVDALPEPEGEPEA